MALRVMFDCDIKSWGWAALFEQIKFINSLFELKYFSLLMENFTRERSLIEMGFKWKWHQMEGLRVWSWKCWRNALLTLSSGGGTFGWMWCGCECCRLKLNINWEVSSSNFKLFDSTITMHTDSISIQRRMREKLTRNAWRSFEKLSAF